MAVRGEQWCHVAPRVRGLRPPVQQDQRDRPAAMLDKAEPPTGRLPTVGIVPSGAAPAVIADHVADCSQAAGLSALTYSGEIAGSAPGRA